jgi:hypothetical protein
MNLLLMKTTWHALFKSVKNIYTSWSTVSSYLANSFKSEPSTVEPHYNGLVGDKGCPF